MDWTAAQREELAREYARLDLGAGVRLPFPEDPRLAEPAAFLTLLRRVPDGAGLTGYLDALRRSAGR